MRPILAAAIVLGGCTQATAPSARPTATALPTPTAVPTPSPTPTPIPVTPAPPTPMAFPRLSEVDLMPGRYSSSPPFDIPFTFEIPDVGWVSAHLHGEFFDVMRLDDANPGVPTRWVAWAHPQTVYGTDEAAASGLTPAEAAATVASNPDVVATETRLFEIAEIDGVQLDVHATQPAVSIFGGPDGDFDLQPSHDARLGFVTVDGELVIVLCLGAPDELDEACADGQPILDSVRF